MMMATWKCTAQRYLFARSKFRIAASVFLPTAYRKLSFVQYADCETRVGSLYSFVFSLEKNTREKTNWCLVVSALFIGTLSLNSGSDDLSHLRA